MRLTPKSLAIAAATAIIASSGIALAEDVKPTTVAFIEDVGGQERINFSGKLRMLSQRIPSAACHLAMGVDTEGAQKLLAGATVEFEKILLALEFGDEDLKIKGAEERRKTLAQIHDLRSKWEPMKASANTMVSGDVSQDHVDFIMSQNMEVLGSAKILVSDLVAQYSDPASMIQADSMLIDISGRQRMLTQKMSKESCMIESGIGTAETVEHLKGTMDLFEASLNALMNGLPTAGVMPPPNAEISQGLQQVYFGWNGVKPTLETILGGKNVDKSELAAKFQGLNKTMADMNKVVGMYTASAKKGV